MNPKPRRLFVFTQPEILFSLSIPCRLRIFKYIKFYPFSTYVKQSWNDIVHVKKLISHCYGYFKSSLENCIQNPSKGKGGNRKIYFLNSNLTIIFSTYISATKNKILVEKYFVPFQHIYKLRFSPSCEINKKKIKKCRKLLYKILPRCKNLQKLDYGVGQVLDVNFLEKCVKLNGCNIGKSLVKINLHDKVTFGKSLELFKNLENIVKWKDEPLKGIEFGKWLMNHKKLKRLKSTPDNESIKYILQNESLSEVRLYVENLSPDSITKLFQDKKFKVIKTANMKEENCFTSLAKNKTLKEISFSFMNMKVRSKLMRCLSLNRSLTSIWIDNSQLCDIDVTFMMKSPLVHTLRKLNISKNNIQGHCLHIFYENSVLKRLNLSGNNLSFCDPEEISNFFTRNNCIEEINLMKTGIQFNSNKIVQGLKNNNSIVVFECHYNSEFLKAIMKECNQILMIICHFYSKQRETMEWIRDRDKPIINYFGSYTQVIKEEKRAKKKRDSKKLGNRDGGQTGNNVTPSSQRDFLNKRKLYSQRVKHMLPLERNIPQSLKQNPNSFVRDLFGSKQFDRAVQEVKECCKLKAVDEESKNRIKNELFNILKKEDRLNIVTCSGCEKISIDVKRCSQCKIVYYCSGECQRKDWSSHKVNCVKKENE